MSTKAIRAVLHDLRQRALPTEAELNAMEREVEAIERAAKALVAGWRSEWRQGMMTSGEAYATIESIDKEEP